MKDTSKKTRRSSYPSRETPVRVAVFGEPGVGKSALTVQFVCGRFLSEYDPTLEDTYTKKVTVNEKDAQVHVLDTAGFDEEDDVRSLHREAQVRANDAFVIVYSETDRRSFESARSIHALVARSRPNASVALVANKSDLAQFRTVSEEEGRELAAEFGGSCRYFRTSAAQGHEGIESVMEFLVQAKRAFDSEQLAQGKKHRRIGRSFSDLKGIQKTLLKWLPKLT
eukprot:m.309951 g.309951  ORF g.309951 m.309951 type:complete len:225 (+) comp48697_c0_seq1:51-725(+)